MKIWVEFETYITNDKKQMEEIMNQVIKMDNSLDTWLDYISYEKYFGDMKSITKIYKKAFEYCKNKKNIGERWQAWENMYI